MKSIEGIPDTYPKVTVRYEGAVAKHSITGLATRTRYGRKRKGDIFQMYKADVDANAELFTIVAMPTQTATTLPKSPADIRVPDQDLRPSIKEVEPQEDLSLDGIGAGQSEEAPSSFVETPATTKKKTTKKTSTRRKSTRKKSTRKTSSSRKKAT